MRRKRRALKRWHSGADPFIAALMQAEDRVLLAGEGPASALTASCDELIAACREGERWLVDHPCPDLRHSLQTADRLVWRDLVDHVEGPLFHRGCSPWVCR
jgi:hypothetical protein